MESPLNYTIRLALSLGSSWKTHSLPDDCPWRAFTVKVHRAHSHLIILPKRDARTFLADMPDDSSLADLLLPGTHDTMALYGWPISQCQDLATPLVVQLNAGIRVLDIRMAVIKGKLIAYHGIYPQRTPFANVITTLRDFLANVPSETLVMSLKQEDFPATSAADFSRIVHDEMMAIPELWFLENRIPTLREVRGKVVLLSRFGGDGSGWEGGLEGLGIHPTRWPNSAREGFEWTCKGTTVRTQDWYNIPSFLDIPEKVDKAVGVLLPPPGDKSTLSISYFSAASFPLALPPTVAKGFGWPKAGFGVEGVNSRVGRWLLDRLAVCADIEEKDQPRIRGWALTDFFQDPESALVPLLIECNYYGR
ncbi:PLC-like phosphodiesterase [Cylindrobasidium torrendii FP15055 ss-10]|uniref:PLC-like phosphodiesterase n=1 Tax=Cylindrobasidium torrendii FP15055 ss-10 TaxID=1314674 RepID=A0A0D7B744_9AGAR|nr:PLC-like phosphodiesterase [Cylindrobasidium torrendii FP15055 ss-10]